MKFLNFGSLNLDMVYSVAHTVRPGETVASTRLDYFCGGKGLNQSIALARAGARVFHAGCVGEDGKRLTDKLTENSVDVSLVRTSKQPSGHAIIQVEKNGQNSILIFGGANREITSEQIQGVVSGFSDGDRLILQNEINGIPEIIDCAHEKGMEIVFNPSPFGEEIKSFPLEKIKWFVVNETEAQELTGQSESERILKEFADRFPKSNVLLTLGGNGAYCLADGEVYHQSIFRVPVADTTAAGDTFLGYFFAVLDEQGVENALRYAAAASAIAVSRSGASASIPTIDEVKKFLI